MGHHVAFKCTYNNGGTAPYVGYAGTCSDDIINHNLNIRERPNCNRSECRAFWDGGCKGRRPEAPCYESELFKTWRFGSGWYQTGNKANTPIPMASAQAGKLAILTTRFPEDSESQRKIFGLFRIGRIEPGDLKNETWLEADENDRIKLTVEEAHAARFWDYNNGSPDWRTGLFRYLDDEAVKRLLLGLRFVIREDASKLVLDRLINAYWPNAIQQVAPDTLRNMALVQRISAARKYGAGGEGESHKRLKKWVSENPNAIGLHGVIGVKVEHVFDCGDTVDIMFTHADGTYTVVEVETLDVYPGALQSIKYRALQCAHLREPLDSPKVRAVLVAWTIPPDVANFCDTYAVQTIEKCI